MTPLHQHHALGGRWKAVAPVGGRYCQLLRLLPSATAPVPRHSRDAVDGYPLVWGASPVPQYTVPAAASVLSESCVGQRGRGSVTSAPLLWSASGAGGDESVTGILPICLSVCESPLRCSVSDLHWPLCPSCTSACASTTCGL